MRENQTATDTSSSAKSPSVIGMLAPVAIILLGVAAFAAFGGRESPRRESDAPDTAAIVQTSAVEPFTEPFIIEVDGESTPYRLVTLSAEVAGRVAMKSPLSRGGMFVPEGTVLFEIDRTDFQLAVERLEAQVRQSQEELATTDVEISNTQKLISLAKDEWVIEQRQVKRREDLAQRGATSGRDLDDARVGEVRKKNALQVLNNEVLKLQQKKLQLQAARDLADAQRRQAVADLERTRVASPMDATVVDDHVEEGDFVKVGDPLVQLSDAGRMEVHCSLPVDDLVWVWLNSSAERDVSAPSRTRLELPPTPVEVRFAFQGHEMVWDGTLARYAGNGLDPTTRLVDCRVVVDHPEQARLTAGSDSKPVASPPALVSGMYVSVRIPISSPVPLLRLPDQAVRPGGQVWVVRDGKLHIIKVDIAETIGDSVLIRQDGSELQPGDRAIVSPLAAVREGMPVQEDAAP